LFAFIGFPHAEYVAIRATRCVPNDNHPPRQQTVADDSHFPVLFANVFDLKGNALKDHLGIRKVQTSFYQRLLAFYGIEGDAYSVIVATTTENHKLGRCDGNLTLEVANTPQAPRSGNGVVTPIFKVKRNRIEDAYGEKYEAWLKQRKPVVWVEG
jgi:hypothetical protein